MAEDSSGVGDVKIDIDGEQDDGIPEALRAKRLAEALDAFDWKSRSALTHIRRPTLIAVCVQRLGGDQAEYAALRSNAILAKIDAWVSVYSYN